MPQRDPFFDRQPPLTFIEELKQPLYVQKPVLYGSRARVGGEIDAGGIYLASPCPDPLLETAWRSFVRFSEVYGIGGDRYPVSVSIVEREDAESFHLEICEDGISVCGDREGVRRALIWLEDELRRAEAPYLTPRAVERRAVIRSRITRCFFSPINRYPKFGDELSDDIDYYPEEYLDRLMHDGANAVWIYTRFSDLVESSLVPGWGIGREARLEKLRRVIRKCARYGIGVYLFAIEPFSLSDQELRQTPALGGKRFSFTHPDGRKETRSCVCVTCEEGKRFVYESGRRLVEAAPDLRGLIFITEGERNTSCASMPNGQCPKADGCPLTLPALLSADVEALRSGVRAANPACEVISWTYGHRLWDHDAIKEYVETAPLDVMLMQNFEDMGYGEQLGRIRQCVDYWLSYVGPSEMFRATATEAQRLGKHIFAKMQVCCSHEIASVPYVPVPGILYEKYAAARECGVSGIMQCWYFGNYPSMMSKAAGELAFMERFEDKEGFLTELAAIYWGRSRAKTVRDAWNFFERGYRAYPMNVMFSYYGPMHDSVVWKLQLEPKNRKLPRSWQTLDPIDGDRIGECLLQGHTLGEAYTLASEMCERWERGIRVLRSLPTQSEDMREQRTLCEAIGVLFRGGRNILEFYLLRDRLGYGEEDAPGLLDRMERLVLDEIENSREMLPLCEADARLGYHSEGEGYKFFREKLLDRIEALRSLLAAEFPLVRARVAAGEHPLPYYLGCEEGTRRYFATRTLASAPLEPIGEVARFRATVDGTRLELELLSDAPVTYHVCPEYRLFLPNLVIAVSPSGVLSPAHPSSALLYNASFGDRIEQELARYSLTAVDGGWRLSVDLADFGNKRPHPFKLRIVANGVPWCPSEDGFVTLGLIDVVHGEYGWIIP